MLALLSKLLAFSVAHRWLVVVATLAVGASRRLQLPAPADRRRPRHHERPGPDQHAGEGALAGRGRAADHLSDRVGHGRHSARRAGALALALRPLAGHGHLRGRHRHLLGAATRRRAPRGRQGEPAAGRRRAADGADRDRARRDLHVDARGRRRTLGVPTASPTTRPTCARFRTGSSGRRSAPSRASPRSTRSAASSSLYQVSPDPAKLVGYGLSFRDVLEALAANNANAGGGYIEHKGEQYLIRATGLVRTRRTSRNIVVGDRATVRRFACRTSPTWASGRELRTGAATDNGREAVIGTAIMLVDENSRDVSRRVDERMKTVNKSLAGRREGEDGLRPHLPRRRDASHRAQEPARRRALGGRRALPAARQPARGAHRRPRHPVLDADCA